MLKKEKETESKSTICLDLESPYSVEFVAKPYPVRYVIPQFQNFDYTHSNTHEHVVRFLDLMGAHANDHLKIAD